MTQCTNMGVLCEQEAALTALPVRAAKAIRTAVTLAFLFWLWGSPALLVESRALWPLTRLLTAQHSAAPGGVVAMSAIATLAITRRASSAIAAALAP